MSTLKLGRGSVRQIAGWRPSKSGGVFRELPALATFSARRALPPPIAQIVELEGTPLAEALSTYREQLVEGLRCHAVVQLRREGAMTFDDGAQGWAIELEIAALPNAGTIQLHVLREGGEGIHHLLASASTAQWASLKSDLNGILSSYRPANQSARRELRATSQPNTKSLDHRSQSSA